MISVGSGFSCGSQQAVNAGTGMTLAPAAKQTGPLPCDSGPVWVIGLNEKWKLLFLQLPVAAVFEGLEDFFRFRITDDLFLGRIPLDGTPKLVGNVADVARGC